MNIYDDMSDTEVLRVAAKSLSAAPVPRPPDAKTVMARGLARRRRRHAGIGIAGTAAVAAAAIGLTGVLAAGPAPTAGTIRTAAFTLVKNQNGSVTLTLTNRQVFHPNALQRALAQDGIPAVVRVGAICTSNPQPDADGVVSVRLPDGSPLPLPSPQHPVPPATVTVINPTKMPAGTALSVAYLSTHRAVMIGLVNADSYTCHTLQSSAPPK